jgi:hypothetical protein
VITATEDTQETASQVLVASDELSRQGETLKQLRGDMTGFLAELRKTG